MIKNNDEKIRTIFANSEREFDGHVGTRWLEGRWSKMSWLAGRIDMIPLYRPPTCHYPGFGTSRLHDHMTAESK
jgi:hypothetical protein